MARSAYAAIAGMAVLLSAAAALAGAPFCQVEATCTETSDNCVAAEGRLQIDVLPSGKASVLLNDHAPLESTILDMNGMIMLIFHDGKDEHQLRIQPDGKFNYLISKPDPDAFNGKNQILYRGQCVEG